MDEWEFAFWSENAEWLHSKMLLVQQTNAASMMMGGMSQPAQPPPQRPPRPPRPPKK